MAAFLATNVAVDASDRSAGDKCAQAQALLTESVEPLVVSAQVRNEFYVTVTRKRRATRGTRSGCTDATSRCWWKEPVAP